MGTINTNTIASKIMNIDWNYGVYLPDGFDSESIYNALILFHGANGNHTNLRERIDILPKLDELLNDTIVFFIDGFNSFYLNGKGIKMESMIMTEFIPFIKTNYNIRDLMLGGVSMGGYGVTRLSLKYPKTFTKVFAVAPAVWRQLEIHNEIAHWTLFQNQDGIDHEFWTANHPSRLINHTNTKYYIETGKKDEVVPFMDVVDFTNSLKEHCNLEFVLTENGDHSWEYFEDAVINGLRFIRD